MEGNVVTMAKTEFLQIRLTPEDRERLAHAAAADHLDVSTWARRLILRSVEDWERQRSVADSNVAPGEVAVVMPTRPERD